MGMFEDVLAWMDNKRRVAKRNASDLWNDPYNALQKTAYNTAQTVRELPDDPGNFLGGGVGVVKGAKPLWGMTRKEYDTPPVLKPQESFYEKFGSNDVEIVRNPSPSDIATMKAEARKEFPNSTYDDPLLRSTSDADGNNYYWKAHLGVHQQVEPSIARREGVDVDQNAGSRLSHRGAIRKALYDGENVPDNVIAEYPGILQEVFNIKGNKLGTSGKYARPKEHPSIFKDTTWEPPLFPDTTR